MRGKNFRLLFFGILALVFFMSFGSAVLNNATLATPAANANVTGTIQLNATVGGIDQATNASFYWKNVSNATAYWVLLCSTATNISGVFTCSSSTTSLPDNITQIFRVNATNGTAGVNVSAANTVLAVDNTAPVISLLGYVNGTLKNSTDKLTLNVSVTDATSGIYSKSFCRFNINGTNETIDVSVASGTCNTTALNLTGLADGNHTINVYAHDAANVTGAAAATSVVFIDSNGPTVELTATTITKNEITLAISATDTGTGVSSCTVDRSGATVTGTTSVSESGLSCASSYTYTVTCSDRNGHEASAVGTFSTNTCGGGAGGGGATTPKKVNSWTKITPGVATIMKDFNSAIGVKQIQIEVNNEAQNVKITVTKEAGKPAAVSVAKSGKVYQYLQINAENLADKLDKATVQFRVEKTWATTNSVNKDKVVVSKFDSALSKWNELTTTYVSEDSAYYYYDVEVTSFSYFAISEKSLTGDSGADTGVTGTGEGKSLAWLWIVIAVVVLVVIGIVIGKRKK